MGLFGRKKNKKSKKNKEPESTYAPPEPPQEVESADCDEDLVKVAVVDIEEQTSDDAPDVPTTPSVFSKIASVLSLKSADPGETNPYSEHTDEGDAKKVDIMDRVTASWAAALALWFGLSKVTQVAVVAGAAVGAIAVISIAAAGGRTPMFPADINVAFVGNSYFYVNDLPRFVENIAGGHLHQDSVIHNAASILQIIMSGNGMWHKWATKNAMIGGAKFETSYNTTEYLYDMGACSVPQLLTGHDQTVTYGNQLGSFIDDGQNPCFQQGAYLEYQESTDLEKSWDFVVITDQSKTMAFEDTRVDALAAFNYTYGPILKEYRISPVIVQPHAYSSSGASSTGLDDLAIFTALIMDGATEYKKFLNKRVGIFAQAHVAPVGNAFLAVYEESPSDLWPKLFLDDGIHPSAYGTFVYGCVIYATMTGYMPSYRRVVVDDMESSPIFATARRLQSSSSQAGFPTKDEAAVLYQIAKKVAVKGFKPASLKGLKASEADTSFLRYDNDNVYNGDYTGGQQYAQNNNNYNQMYDNQAEDANYYNGNNDDANNNGYDDGNYYQANYGGDDGDNNDYQQQQDYDGGYGYNGDYGDNNDNGDYDNGDYDNGDYDNGDYDNGDYDNGDYQEEEQDYGDNEADDTDSDYNAEAYEGSSYNEAAQQYYQNKQNGNTGSQMEYSAGNANGNQYYYTDLSSANDGD